MKSKFFYRVSQAAVEMAIFGSLIIVALGLILSYGQRLDNIQQIKMESFRKALQRAYYRNSAVSYSMRRDSYLADGNYGFGQPTSASGSATVMWQKGQPGDWETEGNPSFSYHKINDKMIGERYTQGDHPDPSGVLMLPRRHKNVIGHTGDESEIDVPVSVWEEQLVRNTQSTSRFEKDEDYSQIETNRRASLTEDLAVTAKARVSIQCTHDGVHGETCDVRKGNEQWALNVYSNPLPSGGNIIPGTPLNQGAYLNDTNRIEYITDYTGVQEKSRTWTVSH